MGYPSQSPYRNSANIEIVREYQYLDSRLLIHIKANPTTACGYGCRTKPTKRLGRVIGLTSSGRWVVPFSMDKSKLTMRQTSSPLSGAQRGELTRQVSIFFCWHCGPRPYSRDPKSYNLSVHIHCKVHQCSLPITGL